MTYYARYFVHSVCLSIIVQCLDFVSTYTSILKGNSEQNELITSLGQLLSIGVIEAVFVSKLIIVFFHLLSLKAPEKDRTIYVWAFLFLAVWTGLAVVNNFILTLKG